MRDACCFEVHRIEVFFKLLICPRVLGLQYTVQLNTSQFRRDRSTRCAVGTLTFAPGESRWTGSHFQRAVLYWRRRLQQRRSSLCQVGVRYVHLLYVIIGTRVRQVCLFSSGRSSGLFCQQQEYLSQNHEIPGPLSRPLYELLVKITRAAGCQEWYI
jgi:hypothetical protein